MSDNKSAAALEREAEAVRSRMTETAESLRDKMSPGQMFDEMRDYFSNSDGSVAFTNLKTQVRDNPLPLALIGAGLAWFLLGGGPSADRLRRNRAYGHDRFTGYDDDDIDDAYLESSYTDEDWDGSGMDALGGLSPNAGPYEGRSYAGGSRGSGSKSGKFGAMASSASDRAGSMASSASDRAGSMASGASDAAGSMLSSVKSAAGNVASAVSGAVGSASSAIGGAASGMSHAASSAGGAASSMRHRAGKAGRMMSRGSGRMSRQVRSGYAEILAREPLVLGAIGLAVGSAIGAMLPSTRYENEKLGPYRDKLREEAGKRVNEGIDEAKEVANSTYRAVKEEADKQGLVPGGEGSITERVAKVASTAAATAENQVRGKAEGSKSEDGTSSASSASSGSSTAGSASSPAGASSPSTGVKSSSTNSPSPATSSSSPSNRV